LEEQLGRIERATKVLTLVVLMIGLMFLALFSAFRRPDIGLIIGLLVFAPISGAAWFDVWRLKRTAADYARELRAFEEGQTRAQPPANEPRPSEGST
jgi:hypothetical protein